MKIFKSIAAALAVLIFPAAQIAAQNTTSPYSQFGYGLLNDNTSSAQKQMGGIGYAMHSGRQINVKNPASYAFIDSLTYLFDMGLDFTARRSTQTATSEDEAASESKYGGGLDYITMQFPIGKRLGMSIGLLPYSSVGYSFGSKIANGTNSREGTGGFNQLYLGLGGRILDNLSVGANFSYLFGNIINDVYTITNTNSQALFEQLTEVRDFHVEFGAQYFFNINADNRINLGLVYSPKKSLLGHAEVTKYDINADTEPEQVERAKLKGNASLPETWGGGIGYQWRGRLQLEADFTYQPWSKVKAVNFEGFLPHRFADRWQINFGGEYTHNPVRGNYLQRISFRAGGFYNRDYMMVGDNNVKEYGVGFGFGLPTLSSKTVINLGFEYRHRQATPNPLLKENYFNIRLGINFNELWFFRNKLN